MIAGQKAQIRKRIKKLQSELSKGDHIHIATEIWVEPSPAIQEAADRISKRAGSLPTKLPMEKKILWEGREYTEQAFSAAISRF